MIGHAHADVLLNVRCYAFKRGFRQLGDLLITKQIKTLLLGAALFPKNADRREVGMLLLQVFLLVPLVPVRLLVRDVVQAFDD